MKLFHYKPFWKQSDWVCIQSLICTSCCVTLHEPSQLFKILVVKLGGTHWYLRYISQLGLAVTSWPLNSLSCCCHLVVANKNQGGGSWFGSILSFNFSCKAWSSSAVVSLSGWIVPFLCDVLNLE